MKKIIQKLLNYLFPDSLTKKATLITTQNDYYLLECWNQYAYLPESMLPYVDRIKTKKEWEALGFILEANRLGQIRKIKVATRYFSFIPVNPSHDIEKEAIRTGKRLTQNPVHIQLLLEKGCEPSDFLHFPTVLAPASKPIVKILN